MYHIEGFSTRLSSPVPQDVLLLSRGIEAEHRPALPFISYNETPTYPAYPSHDGTPRHDLRDSQPQLRVSDLAPEWEHSILRPQASPLPANSSTWNVGPSDIGSLASSHFNPSEYSMYQPQQAWAIQGTANVPLTSNPPHEPERCKIRSVFPLQRIGVPSYGGAAATPPDPTHVTLWYLAWAEAVIINGPREFVPQIIYQPGYEGDKKRYVSLAKLHPPIIFVIEGSHEWGIPVPDLLSKGLVRVAGGSEPAFTACGPSICIRVQWPGYPPCHKQVSTKDYTSRRCMIKKEKLAKVVARCVTKFMRVMSNQEMQAGPDRKWKVGRFGITVDDIMLVSLHHVSQGSWQPQLRLRRVIETNVTPASWVHVGGEIIEET